MTNEETKAKKPRTRKKVTKEVIEEKQDTTCRVVIEVTDKKDNSDNCNVEIRMENYDKGNNNEKGMTAVIYNTVCDTLKKLKFNS